jgi:hypothetical protein
MTKIEMVRETLINNLQAELNRLNAERTWIANECEWIVIFKGDIRNVNRATRNYYRDLIIYRDQIEEYTAIIAQDLVTARRWNNDTLRFYVHNDSNIQAWLGWN